VNKRAQHAYQRSHHDHEVQLFCRLIHYKFPAQYGFSTNYKSYRTQTKEASEDVTLKTTNWTAAGSLTEGCVRPEEQGHHWWHADCLGFVNVKTRHKTSLILLMVFTVTRQ